MTAPLRLPLFVFGTLRCGRENHHYLARHFDRMVPAVLPGYRRLWDLMIGRAAGESVDGELYFIKPNEYDATLAGCDELEEIPPRRALRSRIPSQTGDGKYDGRAGRGLGVCGNRHADGCRRLVISWR